MRLGLDYETAGMSWLVDDHGEHVRAIPYIECDEVLDEELEDWKRMATTYYPAWTIPDLIQMLPDTLDEDTASPLYLKIKKHAVEYVYAGEDFFKIGFSGQLLQSTYKMICWLKGNGYIKSIKK